MAPAPVKLNLKDKVEDGEIDLSMSDLQDVPVKEIAAIKKAHSLDLSNNHISLLPKNFPTLVHLVKLDLSKNQLKELPENFGELVKLKHLDLYKNQLQHLPLSFSKLKALKWLDLKDNPLVPAIANVAGPCLESKQCQKCAKDIVNFYSQLHTKVEEEKKVRELQRQKDLQLNAQKKSQEKKSKKKDKSKKNKENGQAVQEQKKSKKINEKGDYNYVKGQQKSSWIRSIYNFFKYVVLLVFIIGSMLFLLTAAKVTYLKEFEDKFAELWNVSLSALPQDVQGFGVQVGDNFKQVHTFTGQAIIIVSNYVCDLTESKSMNIIVTEVGEVFKNVTQAATEVYIKLFGK